MTSVLVTGAGGQLGQALVKTAPAHASLLTADRQTLDICCKESVNRYVDQHKPDVIINAAAYTAVDKAETDVQSAIAVNADGPANLALAAASNGAHVVHVSTDFVFDGTASSPYQPMDAVSPINVYGESKARGEQAVAAVDGLGATILRTAWVYSAQGSNFLTTMYRLMKERDEIRVVADQLGTPTHANGLAEACWRCAALKLGGIHHWTDAGVASWYDFAVAIYKELRTVGLIAHDVAVRPIPSSEFPTAASRPAYGVLDKTDTWAALRSEPVHWQTRMESAVKHLRDG